MFSKKSEWLYAASILIGLNVLRLILSDSHGGRVKAPLDCSTPPSPEPLPVPSESVVNCYRVNRDQRGVISYEIYGSDEACTVGELPITPNQTVSVNAAGERPPVKCNGKLIKACSTDDHSRTLSSVVSQQLNGTCYGIFTDPDSLDNETVTLPKEEVELVPQKIKEYQNHACKSQQP